METHNEKLMREKINKEYNKVFNSLKEKKFNSSIIECKNDYANMPLKDPQDKNSDNSKSSEERFRELQNRCFETFKQKNHDYDNSFDLSMDEEGFAAMRVRGGDKWNRFKKLSHNEKALVKDESITDTLLDLANYCLLTVMWVEKNKKNE